MVASANKLGLAHACRRDTFYKTLNGARVGDTFMSLIYTAELSRVNPLDYLTELLKHPEEVRHSPQEWMPWNYQAAVAAAEAATA